MSEALGVHPIQVGLRTDDGLNVFVTEDGSYHFAYYERGRMSFDQAGNRDDVLYWYCEDIVTSRAARAVGDRAERFQYEYQVLSRLNPQWAKRRVHELAALFRNGQPEDLSLLPNIGEPV